MNNQLALFNGDDGFSIRTSEGSGLIRGSILKFKNSTWYKGDAPFHHGNARFVINGVVVGWVKWEDGPDGKRLPKHVITEPGGYHPHREEMGDTDTSEWPISPMNGQAEDRGKTPDTCI
jgi:hypothetical protein